MVNLNVNDMAVELTDRAKTVDTGRASHTLYGGHDKALRQTLIMLQEGRELAEHESPGEATLLVLFGSVRLSSDAGSWDGSQGDLIPIPPARHRVEAVTDAVMLLSVVKPH